MSKKGSSPAPPDPTQVADAQSAANIASATAQQKLNMVGTSGPTGTVQYVADPNSPGGYTQTTTLSGPEQQTYDLSKQAQNGALNTANTQLGRVNDALATPLTTDGLPALSGGVDLSGVQPGQLKYSFDPGQQVQGQVGPADLTGANKQAQDAAYASATSRLDPQYATAENQERTRLTNQGLSENSDAYRNAMDTFNRGKTDAYSQAQQAAVGQGNTAEQQLFGEDLSQGQFANTAANQEFTQNQGQAQFANTAEGQRQGEASTAAQLALSNAQLQDTARNQGLQERAYIQNQPINQFTGLLGLGQVGQPQGISYTPSQVANTDVIGANALSSQVAQANANRSAQSSSGLMGGLFSLGSAALMASDRRLKRDVRLIRRRRDGVGVYSFRYRSGGPPQIGVMAQELKRVRPDLVVRRADGFLTVNYAGLGEL